MDTGFGLHKSAPSSRGYDLWLGVRLLSEFHRVVSSVKRSELDWGFINHRRLKIVDQELRENWTGTKLEYVIEIFLTWEHLCRAFFFRKRFLPPAAVCQRTQQSPASRCAAPELGCIAVSLTLASQLASLLHLFTQRYTVSGLNSNSYFASSFMWVQQWTLSGCSSVELPSEQQQQLLCLCEVKAGPWALATSTHWPYRPFVFSLLFICLFIFLMMLYPAFARAGGVRLLWERRESGHLCSCTCSGSRVPGNIPASLNLFNPHPPAKCKLKYS